VTATPDPETDPRVDAMLREAYPLLRTGARRFPDDPDLIEGVARRREYLARLLAAADAAADTVPVPLGIARRAFTMLMAADRAGVYGKCATDPCEECTTMEALQAAIFAADETLTSAGLPDPDADL
jgi:hypothetical protein